LETLSEIASIQDFIVATPDAGVEREENGLGTVSPRSRCGGIGTWR
jgi:hypothetical protein